MEQWLERAQMRLNSEAFQALVQRIQYEDLTRAHRELADVIGVEATLKLCETMGGSSLSVSGNRFFIRQERDRMMLESYRNGATGAQIAAQYSLTPCGVRLVLRNQAAGKKPKCPGSIVRMIEIIGMEKTRKLCNFMGSAGGTLYIPGNSRLKQYLRNLEIHEAFYGEGLNISELAERYDVTDTSIRNVIHTHPKDLSPGIRQEAKKR